MNTPAPVAVPILLLAIVGFLSSAGSRVIDPLLSVIAADFHTTVPAVSIVVAAYTLPYGLCQIFLGPAGDRFGKMRMILFAIAAFSIAMGACALAQGVASLALLRILAGAASAAIIPVGMALIADAVPYAERQVTLSRFLNGIVLSQLLAGPVGGVAGQYVGWRGVFILLALGGLLATAILARRMARIPERRGPASFNLTNFIVLARTQAARRILTFGLLDGALLMGCFPFLAPYMHEQFGLAYASVGMILACFGIGALAYTRSAKHLIPRIGEAGCVTLGGTLMACAVAAGVLTPTWWSFIPIETTLGLGFYMLHGVMQARSTELLPHARATAVSSFAFVLFLGQSIGALTIGALIAATGYRTAFLVDAVSIAMFATGLRWIIRRTAV